MLKRAAAIESRLASKSRDAAEVTPSTKTEKKQCPALREDQKKEVVHAFELFDGDETGFINAHELKVIDCIAKR